VHIRIFTLSVYFFARNDPTSIVAVGSALRPKVFAWYAARLAKLIAESFTGRLRYSGSSLGYQLASIIAGGPAPLIATWLFGTYHSSTAIAICGVITLIATAMMTDYTGRDISGEYQAR
jgi:hypothetical protein